MNSTLWFGQAAAFGAAFAIVVLGAGSMYSNAKDAVIVSNQYTVTICVSPGLISTAVILAHPFHESSSGIHCFSRRGSGVDLLLV